MRETTVISTNVMRFPTMLIESERNDIVSSKNAYDVFASFRRLKLGLKQAVYPSRCLQILDSKQTVIQKFRDDSPLFRMWIDFLSHYEWIARSRGIMHGRFSIYWTIVTITHDLEDKVASPKAGKFTDIEKGVEMSEN
jgi:hypothetical protein